METRESNALVDLLKVSIDEYRHIAELHQVLLRQLDEGSDEPVEAFAQSFATAQDNARQTDRRLNEQLDGEFLISEEAAQLLERKYAVQREIREILEQLIPKAMSVKSLLASEMQSLRNGRKALSGYKNNLDFHGRLVNKRM